MEPGPESCWLDDLSDASSRIKEDRSPVESISPSLSDSTSSSRCNSTVSSYDYNPDDFPRACEIEEFPSPSFQWLPSPILSRLQTAGRLASMQDGNLPKKISTKLQWNVDHLNILVSLSADNSVSSDVVRNAQHTIDKAVDLITTYPGISIAFSDMMEMVKRLDTAIADMSNLLGVNAVIAKSIQLAEQVVKTAGEVGVRNGSYTACQELKIKADRLAGLLWEAGRTDLYARPIPRLLAHAESALYKAASLVAKCHARVKIARRVFTIIPAKAFKKISLVIENAIGNISWLLRVSKPSSSTAADDEGNDRCLDLPPFYTDEPILCLIWDPIAKLLRGSPDDKAAAAASLASLAPDYGKQIIEEGGAGPLLELVKEGNIDAQGSAAQALGLLGCDLESVEIMVQAGACPVFTKLLEEGPMEVQAMVSWAVSELASHCPRCQDSFAQQNAVQLLVECLLNNKNCSTNTDNVNTNKSVDNTLLDHSDDLVNIKDHNCAMAARALGALAKGNSRICRSITDSRLMSIFPLLLEESPHEVQRNSADLLLEMARMAELGDADMRSYFFNLHSPEVTAIVNLLLRIVRGGKYDQSLLFCITTLGCLSRIFWTSEPIQPLVNLLDGREEDVMLEAVIALSKFVEDENYLHKSHRKAVMVLMKKRVKRHIVRLVDHSGVADVRKAASILLSQLGPGKPQNLEEHHGLKRFPPLALKICPDEVLKVGDKYTRCYFFNPYVNLEGQHRSVEICPDEVLEVARAAELGDEVARAAELGDEDTRCYFFNPYPREVNLKVHHQRKKFPTFALKIRSNEVLEVACAAELGDEDTRCYFFNPYSRDVTAFVNQLLRIVRTRKYNQLLVYCIKILGSLSRIFWTSEAIGPLVKLLDALEPLPGSHQAIARLWAVITLIEFVVDSNYLHKSHCQAVISNGGASHLVQLVYLGENAQVPALTVLCYLAKHVPHSEELAQAAVLRVLDWASEQFQWDDAPIDRLLQEAKSKLELHQSRGG